MTTNSDGRPEMCASLGILSPAAAAIQVEHSAPGGCKPLYRWVARQEQDMEVFETDLFNVWTDEAKRFSACSNQI
ncbi:hypothetical protein OUZ56_015333 [Daphnia magna]|uniref:Uncharacterized protein n=1 Tax=Daphnia magna TaxID=35525 RepID=A0ABR0AMI4_9CRUS|nr:hypothetical protein OUZ56_015333 [Daphnia magna]